ncbi:MAG: DUF58 domain-containing protein [Burkholderiales bacterium]|nr:DUF58 domain-containing protein [Anaerolineae bacterium]
MPTSRTYSFIVAALTLYFFATTTQIGWLYVMSALLLGMILAAWMLNRKTLNGISAAREVGEDLDDQDRETDIHEADTIGITLTLRNARRIPAAHLRTVEICPFAAPGSPERELKMFAPSLPARGDVTCDYEVIVDRRGLHEFPPLAVASRAPFGFFERRKSLALPTRVLIYPELRKLRRLSLLDNRPSVQESRPRAGVGSEVIGVRPYRSGDSPRHIHWRSVARTGELISKEFADEARPGLTIALDMLRDPRPWIDSKHTPYEWAVKAAASIGEYAQRRNFPLHILADIDALMPPPGPLTWTALMQYLARIQPTGTRTLADVLDNQPVQTLVAALICVPDMAMVNALAGLHHRGLGVLAVVFDPESFPAGGPSAAPLADALTAIGIDTRLVRYGDDWTETLSENDITVGARHAVPLR